MMQGTPQQRLLKYIAENNTDVVSFFSGTGKVKMGDLKAMLASRALPKSSHHARLML